MQLRGHSLSINSSTSVEPREVMNLGREPDIVDGYSYDRADLDAALESEQAFETPCKFEG